MGPCLLSYKIEKSRICQTRLTQSSLLCLDQFKVLCLYYWDRREIQCTGGKTRKKENTSFTFKKMNKASLLWIPVYFSWSSTEVLFMLNRLHLACLKMTQVWIMNDLQPIQEVVIIEIIEKYTPCRICTERQLFQTVAVLLTLKSTVDFFLFHLPKFTRNALFSIASCSFPVRRLGKAEWNFNIWKVGGRGEGDSLRICTKSTLDMNTSVSLGASERSHQVHKDNVCIRAGFRKHGLDPWSTHSNVGNCSVQEDRSKVKIVASRRRTLIILSRPYW